MTIGVRQLDVAKKAGVSVSAVGFALGENAALQKKLSHDTRQRILKTAQALGYRPHHYAQVMRRGKTGTIAMLQMSGSLYVNDMRALHVARAIHGQNYRLLTHHVLWHVDGVQDALDAVLDARAEGLILVGPTEHVPPNFLKQIRDARIALVSLSGVRFPGVPQVRSDFRQGTREVTNHLLSLGYRRLVLLTSWASQVRDDDHRWPVQERIDGFQEAIAQSGCAQAVGEVVCVADPAGAEPSYMLTGKTEMQKLLRQAQRPEAVVCSNDSWALGALAACAEAGVRVPQDLAITGIDNDPVGEIIQPPLTTSAQPTEAIATKAVEILLKQIRGEKLSASDELVKMPCRLVVRQSCGATRVWEKVTRQAFQPGKSATVN